MKRRKKGKKTKKTKKIKKVRKAKKLKKTRKAKRVKKVTRAKKIKKVRKPKRVARAKKIKRPKRAKKIKKIKKVAKAKKVEKPKEAIKFPKVERVEITEKPAAPAAKVPYTLENAQLCICSKCPVQAESMCAKEKMEKIQAMMQTGAPEGTMPPAEDLPGLYCSTGVAACKDLDFTKMCMCGGCQVWAKCNLASGKPMGYFCRDGKAE